MPPKGEPFLEIREQLSNGPEAAAQARRLLDRLGRRVPEVVLIDARIVLGWAPVTGPFSCPVRRFTASAPRSRVGPR